MFWLARFISIAIVAVVSVPTDAAAWSGTSAGAGHATPTSSSENSENQSSSGGSAGPALSTTDQTAGFTSYSTSPNKYADLEDPDDADGDPDGPSGILISTSIGLATGATTVGGIMLTVMSVDDVAAENYLRENSVALRHHLHRGAGGTIDDLAHLCGIPIAEHSHFAQILHRQRMGLLAYLEQGYDVDAEATHDFFMLLGEAILDDPRLMAAIIVDRTRRGR